MLFRSKRAWGAPPIQKRQKRIFFAAAARPLLFRHRHGRKSKSKRGFLTSSMEKAPASLYVITHRARNTYMPRRRKTPSGPSSTHLVEKENPTSHARQFAADRQRGLQTPIRPPERVIALDHGTHVEYTRFENDGTIHVERHNKPSTFPFHHRGT